MTVLFVRILFILVSGMVGYYVVSTILGSESSRLAMTGGGAGILFALAIIWLETGFKKVSIRNLSAAVFGLIFGLLMSLLFIAVIRIIPMEPPVFAAIQVVMTLILCYLGMMIAMRGKDEFNILIPYVKFQRQDLRDEVLLLDTSVIIDGRIADMANTKFLEGRFVIPRFVLKELHQIADSQDSLKRARGRRGLDILGRLQQNPAADVKIQDDDFADIPDVDAKLVKLATVLGAKILTNDYNLNKVAGLQGVRVLNLNDLTLALRPVVLPGESLEVRIIKEGKEHNQGVAYLEDGTMVVVENGRSLIGKTLSVEITSVLQTAAGKMIFAKPSNSRKGGG